MREYDLQGERKREGERAIAESNRSRNFDLRILHFLQTQSYYARKKKSSSSVSIESLRSESINNKI